MKREGFYYVPQARVIFTKAEMHLLLLCSLRHYDGVCRDAGNIGGFLYGLKNRLGDDGEVEANLEFRQLDTLAKVVEPVRQVSQEQIDIYFGLRRAMAALNKEGERLNPFCPVCQQYFTPHSKSDAICLTCHDKNASGDAQ